MGYPFCSIAEGGVELCDYLQCSRSSAVDHGVISKALGDCVRSSSITSKHIVYEDGEQYGAKYSALEYARLDRQLLRFLAVHLDVLRPVFQV